jgi:putative chitinase
MVTPAQLKKIAPLVSNSRIAKYLGALNITMDKYEINTPLRQAHFLAQILHESGSLLYSEEIASGSAYEGRKNLGNTQPGDGIKFKGRGLMQLTGRANYAVYGKYIGVDLEAHPELVATTYAVDVAGWFFATKNLNELADKDDVATITKRINGGLNGFAERKQYLDRAKKEFGI